MQKLNLYWYMKHRMRKIRIMMKEKKMYDNKEDKNTYNVYK